MNFMRRGVWITRCRTRAKRIGCVGCQKTGAELGTKGEMSLTSMQRSGASIADLKAAIRESGWWCRKCVRQHKGTAATTTNLRDQFTPGPSGDLEFQRYRYKTLKDEMTALGYEVTWDEAAGRMRCVVPAAV